VHVLYEFIEGIVDGIEYCNLVVYDDGDVGYLTKWRKSIKLNCSIPPCLLCGRAEDFIPYLLANFVDDGIVGFWLRMPPRMCFVLRVILEAVDTVLNKLVFSLLIIELFELKVAVHHEDVVATTGANGSLRFFIDEW
jgi:hypothetical protein